MATKELIEKIQKDLSKSGYPLEVFCKKVLLESGFGISIGQPYLTKDGVLRSIDAEGDFYSDLRIKDRRIGFYSMAYIECKKNDNHPWIFFQDEHTRPEINVRSSYQGIEEFFHQLEMKRHHYNKDGVFASSYKVAFCGADSKEAKQIYEAVQQVRGFCDHGREMYELYEKEDAEKNKNQNFIQIVVEYLTIVFDGELFMVNCLENEVVANETQYVLLVDYSKEMMKYKYYTIEIVKKDYLPTYLSDIKQTHKLISKRFLARLRKIL